MYQDFYQLKEKPFNLTADPDFFFSSKSHREAISNLSYGIQERKGIIVVTGEVGTGKTTLCRKLLSKASKNVSVSLVLNPDFSEIEFLQMIIRDFGIRTREQNKLELMNILNQFLIKESKKNRKTILIIDEAQKLSPTQLEHIRLLSDLETTKEKLLQIILVGQPELNNKLDLAELRQLNQRIAIHFQIQPLEKNDIQYYFQHRITKASRHPKTICNITLTEQAIESIFNHTKGSPRKINILCDRALLAGFGADTHIIDNAIIENCAKEPIFCEQIHDTLQQSHLSNNNPKKIKFLFKKANWADATLILIIFLLAALAVFGYYKQLAVG